MRNISVFVRPFAATAQTQTDLHIQIDSREIRRSPCAACLLCVCVCVMSGLRLSLIHCFVTDLGSSDYIRMRMVSVCVATVFTYFSCIVFVARRR